MSARLSTSEYMTGTTGKGGGWCRTTVAIRDDILAAARSADLDIQDLCNRALADAAGIRYSPVPKKCEMSAGAVIVASTDHPHAGAKEPDVAAGETVHPVINADDPRAWSVIKELPRPKPVQKPATLPGRVSITEQSPECNLPVTAIQGVKPRPEREKKAPGKKAAKHPARSSIRQFVAEHIVRDDGEGCHISKEALYSALAHWCRERRMVAPDRRTVTVTLKNQFAMTEAAVNGEPSWTNARFS